MTQRLLAGIDGGQSSTTAAIGDCSGRVLGRGSAGPADEIGEGANSSRLRDALRGALTAACDRAGLDRDTHFDTIVAGVSGYEGRVYGRAAELPAARVLFMHDAPVAHAGALGGHPGIVAIAGTGSVVYGTDGKRAWTLGGWGHLFGDEGSAFWFAREALSRLMCSQDAGDASNAPERDAACAFFAQPSLRHLARAFYAGELTRERIAAFAVDACSFELFRDIADRGAQRLAELVRSAIHAGAHPVVACIGGMFGDARFRERAYEGIASAGRAVRIVEPKYAPDIGALLLAYREARLPEVAIRT